MKRLVLIAFAAILLSACTHAELELRPSEKISFEVGWYATATKTGETHHAMDTTLSFRSRAFLHADDGNGGYYATQDFFGPGMGEEITYVQRTSASESGSWQPGISSGKEYFWPFSSSSYINFICWYDKNGAPDTTNLSETSLSWTIDGQTGEGHRTLQSDDVILYADEAWRYSSNTANSAHYDQDAILIGVPVIFHNALAQVCFKGKIADGCEMNGADEASSTIKYGVTVKAVRLLNVYSTGTLTMTNADPELSSRIVPWTVTNDNWVTSGTAAPLEILAIGSDADDKVLTGTVDLCPMTTVLPQPVNSGMLLTVVWTITYYRKVNGSWVEFSQENINSSSNLSYIAAVEAWEMGHRITYTMSFDPTTDTIVFQPSMEDWTDLENSAGVVVE